VESRKQTDAQKTIVADHIEVVDVEATVAKQQDSFLGLILHDGRHHFDRRCESH